MTQRRHHNQAGFTLYEALISILLTSVVVGTFAVFSRYQLYAMLDQASQVNVQSTARAMVDLFAGEIRRACAIVSADDRKVRIVSDLDGSGAIDAVDEDVTYRFKRRKKELQRVAGGNVEVLTDKALSCTLRYFDGAGNEIAAPRGRTLSLAQRQAVRRIRIEATVLTKATDPTENRQVQARIASDVNLRNRYFVNTIQNAACDAAWQLQG